jgi:hypothetical protein
MVQRDLGGAVGVAAREFYVVQFDRVTTADLSDHARHRRLLPVSGRDDRGIVGIDAFQRGPRSSLKRRPNRPDAAIRAPNDRGTARVSCNSGYFMVHCYRSTIFLR